MSKRFIEVDFPIKEVSEQSVRERNGAKPGHISTAHQWWARRPLAASRASILAALVPDPGSDKERNESKNFITEISKWENSNNKELLDKARNLIKKAYPQGPPKVLDCFAGGGSIPLEALRLGCETYALDLNPVAVLILKAVLEYPQKYGQLKKVKGKGDGLFDIEKKVNPLVEDVKKWSNWVLEEAKKELDKFYAKDSDGSIPVGYIWARTIKCQNPSCGAEIPLLKQLWLCNKEHKKVALRLIPDKKKRSIRFEIVEGKEIDFDPNEGTTKRATVQCPICSSGIEANVTRREAQEGRMGQKQLAILLDKPIKRQRSYRIATEDDINLFKKAEKELQNFLSLRQEQNGFSIPEEPLPFGGVLRVDNYGMTKWYQLFNSRQLLTLMTFVKKIRDMYINLEKISSKEYAKAIALYLSFVLDRQTNFCCSLTRRDSSEHIWAAFDKQRLQMVWCYIETNPLITWNVNYLTKLIQHCSQLRMFPYIKESIACGTATDLPYPSDYFDAVITDPPYYDNVPYSDCSDFFYVWLKRMLDNLYPELFATPLTPKSQEIIQEPSRHSGNSEKAKKFFEEMLTQAFREIYRVLKPNGISIIIFAHKSTEAWETVINSLLNSEMILTSSWPIHTERKTRAVALQTASLASSIYMVCRKRTKEETSYFNDIKPQIDQRIKEKLTQFWNEGIGGSDFFISAIGPAVEVFGRYSKVLRLSGEEVSVKELLEYVRKVVSEFALERILKRAELGGVDNDTRFYLLWRWIYNSAKVHFDDARKLAQAVGIELTEHWDRGGFIKKEKEFISVLGPKEREKDEVFMKGLKEVPFDNEPTLFPLEMQTVKVSKSLSMIDTLHHCLILWEKGQKKRIKELLEQSAFAKSEVFWQTAQAISEVLPKGNKEKQLLQGFLYGKDEYRK